MIFCFWRSLPCAFETLLCSILIKGRKHAEFWVGIADQFGVYEDVYCTKFLKMGVFLYHFRRGVFNRLLPGCRSAE